MLKSYFGDARSGRLVSRQFLFLWLILIFSFILFGLGVGLTIGIAEHLVGGDLATAQSTLRCKLALPTIIVLAVIGVFFAFAKLNIIAKRARDTGLPGWATAIVILVTVGVAAHTNETTEISGGFGILLLVILTFIPTDKFKKES